MFGPVSVPLVFSFGLVSPLGNDDGGSHSPRFLPHQPGRVA